MLKAGTLKHVAKTVIVDGNGKILVLTRSNTDPKRPGGLDFPGGELDTGEDVLQGAVREINEEVGLHIAKSDLHIIHTHSKSAEGQIILRFLCIAKVNNPTINLSFEHSDYKWMTLQEVVDKFETLSWAEGLRFGIEHKIFDNNLQ